MNDDPATIRDDTMLDGNAGPFFSAITRQINNMRKLYPELIYVSADFLFLCYLNECARMGTFSYGPVTIQVRVVEDLFERTYERGVPGPAPGAWDESGKRFFRQLSRELARSERKRIDELHWLLAFMRFGEGIPAQVFGELGVTTEAVERVARGESAAPSASGRPGPERLYSPEEVAEYLGLHVQTVRTWIRSGKLPARRLAGQRALRIKESDLDAVLEPIE